MKENSLSLTLFKIVTLVRQSTLLMVFLYGGSEFTSKEGTGELLYKFKQKFCAWYIFSKFHNHDYLKSLVIVKSLIKKLCPVYLSPWIIPPVFLILPKMFPLHLSCLFPPTCMYHVCPTPSPKSTVWGKPCRLGG